MNISEYIHNTNKKQKMILINDTYRCLENISCEECKKDYNTDVLIKPITQNQMIEILCNHFKCESYNKDENGFLVQQVKKTILAEHPYINFNENTNDFLLDNIADSLQIPALVDITELLTLHNISYEIFDNNKVTLRI